MLSSYIISTYRAVEIIFMTKINICYKITNKKVKIRGFNEVMNK